MKLKRRMFGDPILRTPARRLSPEEILGDDIQQLVTDMHDFMKSRPKYGVGIAAPQLGVPLAISLITIQPLPHRPDVEELIDMTIINPEIVAYYGRRSGMWEGCISFGTSANNFPYAQTYRYRKVRLRYYDAHAQLHEEDFTDLLAHVIQHETDHLNGILFVDRVKDSTTLMMKSEFVKYHLKKRGKKYE